MNYHKILERQIKKLLPQNYVEDALLSPFLSSISDYYEAFEKDKKISDHAFAISEMEYMEAVKKFRAQNEIRDKSIFQLKEAIRDLDPEAIEGLEESNDDLIDIIGFLHEQIVKTKELEFYLIQVKNSAENAAKAKGDFLSVMSHEIRTPLNAIIGYIHLLLHENPQPYQLEYLRILQISAGNLLSLINDVLDFSKIEEGKIIFAERDFDIRQLVNDLKLANKIRAEERGNSVKIMFDSDIPELVVGDSTRLNQVLNNLLSNAIKFTHNGKIVIEVSLKNLTDDTIEIYFSVTDTGIGISRDKHYLIFERFTQEHSHITREYGGSGLGLAIIRKLLQLQNSDIYLESEPGKGSKFYFSLKFGKCNQIKKSVASYNESSNDLKGLRILVVEDVEFNIMLAEKMLTNWNAKVSVAENGLIAVEKAKRDTYDIILMDVQMPVMDGLTATTEIRKFNKDIPILALTASTSSELQEASRKIGISDFIYKPINPNYLFPTLLKYVKEY